ncbi:MAG: hypothetical protein PUE66_01725 [Erysipelotrichaceae bacterium]|nr:hypothetical protein [Erysipelotrichaceae bacterium]
MNTHIFLYFLHGFIIRKGIDYLVNYYIHSLGWSEDEALRYAIKLFENGVIDEIEVINGKKAD